MISISSNNVTSVMLFSLLLIFELIELAALMVFEYFEGLKNLILNMVEGKLIFSHLVDSFYHKTVLSF